MSSDLELWKKWKEHRDEEALQQLFDKYEPLVMSRASVYLNKGLRIPPAAIEIEHKKQLYNALETYNPNKGASLATHIYNTMQAAHRFIATHQNLARIPETRIFKIGKIQQVEALLRTKYGRTPTTEELAKELKWPIKVVATLKKEIRKDIFFPEAPALGVQKLSKIPIAIKAVKRELSDIDKKVLDGILSGKKQQDIAKSLKMSAAGITRAKQRIVAKLREHLE